MMKMIAVIALTIILAVVYQFFYSLWTNANEKPMTISVVLKSTPDRIDYWQVLSDGVEVAAKEFDVMVDIVGPEYETNIDEQISYIEAAIEKKPDAIVLAVTDYERLQPYAQKIQDAGIQLVTIDSGFNNNHSESFIATDNVAAGKKAGDMISSALDSKGVVAIVSHVKGTSSQLHREQGVREVLQEKSHMKVLDTIYSDSNEDIAYERTKAVLMAEPSITGIVGLNEPSTVGAGLAIKELGLSEQVTLVGFDSSIPEVRLLQEGILYATIVQRPFNMGYLGVLTAIDKIKGKKVHSYVDTGSIVITRENMNEDEHQKLLFPFVGE